MKTLSDFCNDDATLQPDRRIAEQVPDQEESVPLNPPVITNYKLVVIMVEAAFSVKDPERVHLLLKSNGSMEKMATEYYLRRVVN